MSSNRKRYQGTATHWNYATKMTVGTEGFTAHDLSASQTIPMKVAYGIIADWIDQGVIETCGKNLKARKLYRVKQEAAPKLFEVSDGQTGDPLQNMWSAMRLVERFTHLDIQMYSNNSRAAVTVEDARGYCQRLATAGYLRVARKAGKMNPYALYQLIRNTGPLPPKLARKTVLHDPNNDEVTHVYGGFCQ